MLAGCGPSAGSPGLSASYPPGPAARGPRTVTQNQAATRAEAHRLLGLAPIPNGAKPTSNHDGLDSPGLGSQESKSWVDVSAFWHVDQPMSQVWQWVQQHRPMGLRNSGSSEGGGPSGVTSEAVGWGEPDRAYGINFALEVSLAPDNGGKGTTMRADGAGSWLDPQPIRDDNSSQHLRMTVARGCLARVPSMFDVSNTGDDLDHALLPDTKPTGALVCFFSGSNGKPAFGLAGHRRLDPEAAQALARQFSRLRIAHTDGDGPIPCPFADGTTDVVVFAYASRADVDLLNPAGGCPSVSNGHILVEGSVPFKHAPNAFSFKTR